MVISTCCVEIEVFPNSVWRKVVDVPSIPYGLTAINVVGLQPSPEQGGLLVQGLLDSL